MVLGNYCKEKQTIINIIDIWMFLFYVLNISLFLKRLNLTESWVIKSGKHNDLWATFIMMCYFFSKTQIVSLLNSSKCVQIKYDIYVKIFYFIWFIQGLCYMVFHSVLGSYVCNNNSRGLSWLLRKMLFSFL